MPGRFLAHLRSQWLGALALFLVLTGGGAYALSGHNSVKSDDIAPAAVKTGDLAGDAKPRRFAFHGPANANPSARHSLIKLDELKLTLQCVPRSSATDAKLFVRSTMAGEVNYTYVGRAQFGGPDVEKPVTFADGFHTAPRDGEALVAKIEGVSETPYRAEGSFLYKNARRVIEVQFHLQAFGGSNHRCEATGTALNATG